MGAEHAEERVVAIVASAGGLTAIRFILESLPRDFPYPILVLLHLWPKCPSHLAEILNARVPLRVTQGVDGERLERGRNDLGHIVVGLRLGTERSGRVSGHHGYAHVRG